MEEKDKEELQEDFARLSKHVGSLEHLVEIYKNHLDRAESENSERFLKFEKKQDQILDILSDHKAMMVEIENIKTISTKFEERLTRHENNLRESLADIYERCNGLEVRKAEKTDMKENRTWVWGLVILLLTFFANAVLKIAEKLMR